MWMPGCLMVLKNADFQAAWALYQNFIKVAG
jgi:hypothetical protein